MAHLLMRYSEEVLLCYDADEAGQKATQKAIGIFSSIGAKLRVIRLSGGKDPDEILRTYGPERFRSLIDGASNDIEFKLLKAREGLDISSDDGKLKYLNNAAEVLSSVGNSIAVDIYLSRLSEELGVEKDAIRARVTSIRNRRRRQNKDREFQQVQQNFSRAGARAAAQPGGSLKSDKAQKRILTLLYFNPDFYGEVKDALPDSRFGDPACRQIYTVFKERLAEGASLDFSALSGDLGNEEMSLLVGLCKADESLPGNRQELRDCIAVLQQAADAQNGHIRASDLDGEAFKALIQSQKK